MNTKLRNALVGLSVAMGSLIFGATSAYAVDPVAPDPATTGGTILATFGEKLIGIITSMASNTWVLALFGFAIAVTIVRRVLNKGTKAGTKAVG